MSSSSLLSPAEVITINKQPDPKHKPTCIRGAYTLYQFGSAGYRIITHLSNPALATKATFEAFAVPMAELTKSKTVKKVAQAAVNVLSMCTDLPGWALAKTLHTTADAITSYFPTSDRWVIRALKDVVEIAGTETANYGTRRITPYLVAAQKASANKENEIEKTWQTYQETSQKEQELLERQEKVDSMSKDPQTIANNAYNAASAANKHKNKEQIAIELTDATNALSITQPDANRFSDSFITAQEGSPKRHNDHILTQLNALVPAVLAENSKALQKAAINTEQAQKAYYDAVKQETWVDIFFYSIGGYRYDLDNAPQVVQKMQSMFGNMDVHEVIEALYTKNEQAAEGKKNKKFAIAFGITNDLMTILGTDDKQLRDKLFHRILGSMDESDRRWYNDVCGELHQIMTGTETDAFTYESHGLKKYWEKCTKPAKEFLAWIDRNISGPTPMFGAQVDTSKKVDATVNNMPAFNIYTPPTTSYPPQPAPVTRPINNTKPADTVPETVATEPKILLPISIAPFLSPVLDPNLSQTAQSTSVIIAPSLPSAPNPTPLHTAAPAPNTAADTANDLITLGGASLQAATGYGGMSKIGTTSAILKEVNQNYGAGLKTWNIGVELLLGKNPVVSAVTASCDLYKNHVSSECVNTVAERLQSEALNLPDDMRIGLGMSAQFIKSMDSFMRDIANIGPSLQLTPEKVESIQQAGIAAERHFSAFADEFAEVNDAQMNFELQTTKETLHLANTIFDKLFGAKK